MDLAKETSVEPSFVFNSVNQYYQKS